ncbi:hypothetical protein ACFLVS_00855 [Chloroflexota bacterium]
MAERTFTSEQIINKLRKADVPNGRFSTTEPNRSPEDIHNRINITISSFESSPEK